MDYYVSANGKRYRKSRKLPGPKPLPNGLKKRRINICLVPHWHEAGKQETARKGISFSEYLERLVYADSLHNESA